MTHYLALALYMALHLRWDQNTEVLDEYVSFWHVPRNRWNRTRHLTTPLRKPMGVSFLKLSTHNK